jgi:hypothetical protein
MGQIQIHRVDGVGHQRAAASHEPFDALQFETAMHDLQELVLKAVRLEEVTHSVSSDDSAAQQSHRPVEEDGSDQLVVAEGSVLYTICQRLIPRTWDRSVLVDALREDGYAVRVQRDCGGGVRVWATFYISGGIFSRLDIAHDSLYESDGIEAARDLSPNTPSRIVSHLNRWLERSAVEGFAKQITSQAVTLDYLGVRPDTPSSGRVVGRSGNERTSANQEQWACLRGKSAETVKKNYRQAREELVVDDQPDEAPTPGPALLQGDEDDAFKDGDVRLV